MLSRAERTKLLLFFALFFGAVGFLFTLLCCGTEYWLLAAETCSRTEEDGSGGGNKVVDGVRIFHEGLFWRCSFPAVSDQLSVWDIWIYNQPPSKLCHTAFLFPFPVHEPISSQLQPYEHHSAIVYRTFWSIFLVSGVAAVIIGGLSVLCAGPLANHRLYKVGGAFLFFGGLCLLTVVLMYLMWIHVLDTLEQFALHHRRSSCPSFQLGVQHGPSFLVAPVAVFFCLLSGLLFILVGQSVQDTHREKGSKKPEVQTSEIYMQSSFNMEDVSRWGMHEV